MTHSDIESKRIQLGVIDRARNRFILSWITFLVALGVAVWRGWL